MEIKNMKTVIAVHALADTLMSARGALKLVAPVALAAAITSPAFAQSVSTPRTHKAMSAYARSVPAHVGRSPYAVYQGGVYVGTDPDPNVRAALLRQFNWRKG